MNKKLPLYGLLVAVGSAIYVLENYVPFPVPIPGARWGFSNMVIVYALPDTPLSWLFTIAVGKVIIGGLMSGKFLSPTFMMGAGGSVVATIAMSLTFKMFKKSGLIFHSVIGALINNLVQVTIAAQIVATWAIVAYLPYMEIMGILSGVANAIVATILIKRTKIENERKI